MEGSTYQVFIENTSTLGQMNLWSVETALSIFFRKWGQLSWEWILGESNGQWHGMEMGGGSSGCARKTGQAHKNFIT